MDIWQRIRIAVGKTRKITEHVLDRTVLFTRSTGTTANDVDPSSTPLRRASHDEKPQTWIAQIPNTTCTCNSIPEAFVRL